MINNAITESVLSRTDTVSTTIALTKAWSGAWALVGGLRVTAASGTTPSMTVTVQRSLDGVNWDSVLAFTAATAATHQRVQAAITDNSPMVQTSPHMRVNVAITGTTPSFTWELHLVGKV